MEDYLLDVLNPDTAVLLYLETMLTTEPLTVKLPTRSWLTLDSVVAVGFACRDYLVEKLSAKSSPLLIRYKVDLINKNMVAPVFQPSFAN